ncbi:MAG: InlB B-repeat-containing protein, partial [Clostridia bacterium]|nr:InlB B-repeat-containing protein [Clostridia bacterium]
HYDVSAAMTMTGDVILYAEWTAIDYSVTYNGNGNTGGTIPNDTVTYHVGNTVTVLNKGDLAKNGYVFTGWNTALDGSGVGYAIGSTLIMSADHVTLYAQWSMSESSLANQAIAQDKAELDSSDFFYYSGDDASGVSKNFSMPTIGAHGSTFSWSEKVDSYDNITVTSGGATEVRRPTFAEGDHRVTLTATISKTAGTSDSKDIELVIKAYTEAEETAQKELSANEAISLDKAELDNTDFLYYAGDDSDHVTMNFSMPTLGENGSSFVWSEKVDSRDCITVTSGGATEVRRPSFAEGDQVVTVMATISKPYGTTVTKDISVTIKCEESYSVNYVSNGATGGNVPTDSTQYAYGDTVTVAINSGGLYKTGYVFFSWNTAADGSGSRYIQASSLSITGNVMLYAEWVLDETTTSNSGSGSSSRDDGDDRSTSSATTSNQNTSTSVEVNGESQSAGQTSTTVENGKIVTKVTVDAPKIESILDQKENKAVVTVPIANGASTAIAGLSGEVIKKMETKEAVLQVKNDVAIYTLPAAEINIDAVSQTLGERIELSDIRVEIEISEPTEAMVKAVEDAAKADAFTLVMPAVSFEIKCSYNEKEVSVSRFNAYVERMVTIPEGVDVSKISTGVVVEADGSVRHVPTKIIEIDGQYYAKINSLTNSTYSVIWNPVNFKDLENHWAKDSVNNMGSRMIVKGMGGGQYVPEGSVTNAEFITMVVRALGLNAEVPKVGQESTWYEGYLQTACEYGLIEEASLLFTRPNDKMTREAAMVVIAKASKITGMVAPLTEAEVQSLLEAYTDSAQVSAGYEYLVAHCIKSGVITGKTDVTLAMKDDITRAEVAVIIERFLRISDLI